MSFPTVCVWLAMLFFTVCDGGGKPPIKISQIKKSPEGLSLIYLSTVVDYNTLAMRRSLLWVGR